MSFRLFLAALALSLLSCGDGSAPSADAAVTVDAVPGPVSLVDCAEHTPAATVATAGMTFTPADLTISVGDVVFFDFDATSHDAASDDGLFDTGIPGVPGCLLFREAGTYPYHCSVHQPMRATITVQ